MKKSRLHYSLLNSTMTIGIQAVYILCKFIAQTIFIKTLGATYLGVNGLFTNILSLLSFAELGIGDAIVFSLYKPLADNDLEKIKYLMQIFKRAYQIIGLVVGALGLILLPFLSIFVKGNSVPYLHTIFLLFLANSVLSYYFTYKRSLLIADQVGYISSLNQFLFTLIQIIIQIIILLTTKNYILYLIVQVICTVSSNVMISRCVDKKYVYLNNKEIGIDKDKQLLNQLKKNTVGMIGVKVGSIAVFGTDNLIISSFLGVALVGIYSNYTLITSSISNLLTQAVNSVTPSIGNLIAANDKKKEEAVFYQHFFINFMVTYFCAGLLLILLAPFINIWVGEKYVLPFSTTLLIVINFFVAQIRQTSITFISAFGLFWQTRWKSVIEALFNLVLSLVLIIFFHLGIDAVLLGTFGSNIFIDSWWEPLLVFKYGIKLSQKKYYTKCFQYLCFSAATLTVIYKIRTLLFAPSGSFSLVLVLGVYTFLFSFVLIVLFFGRTNEFKYCLKLIRGIMAKLFKQT